MAANSSTH